MAEMKEMVQIKHFFKRIYAIILLIALAVGGGLFVQHEYYTYSVQKEIRSKIEIELDYMSLQIEHYFVQGVSYIDTLENLIEATDDKAVILEMFEKTLNQAPSYLSLYFGTPDSEMINGSGWIPPEDFDLTQRPWYKEAVAAKKMIITQPYLNATKDYWIVTLAKPLYDKTGELVGVIGGDSSLDSIIQHLRNQKISEHSFVFLLNANKELIMHSNVEGLAIDEAARNQFNARINGAFDKTEEGIHIVEYDGNKAFFAWNKIGETGWFVGHYVPFSDFLDIKTQLKIIVGLTALFASIFIGLFGVAQRRYIIKPLIALSRDIQAISVENDISYRLPISKTDSFSILRASTNELLEKTQNYFENMQRSKKALEISEKKTRAILEVIPDLIFLYDQKGMFLDCMVNSDADLLLKREDFIGKTLSEVMPAEIAIKGNRAIQAALRTEEIQMFEYTIDTPDGPTYFETRLVRITEQSVLAIVRNITESKEYMQRIEQLSFHDQLTGLYNRRFYEEELERLDTDRNLPFSLVMLDVNGLKLTNDAFGHIAGDELLKTVAKVLKDVCRTDDIIARIGGDEFVILLPSTTQMDAEIIVNRILEEMKKYIIENVPLSISLGWETKRKSSESMVDVFIKAEDHMYRRKLIESQSMRNKTIKVILETLNKKNAREKRHSENVSEIGRMIGNAMNLSDEVINEIGIAGLMHDIGKIGISEAVLNKAEKLTDAEYVEIMKHPEIGYQILKSVDIYSNLAEYALSHHEKWDGTGYPKGISGKEIPLISRIISVADAYEAMTADRPYRKALSKEAALRELEANSGTQFDPEIVDIFLKLKLASENAFI